MLGCSRLVKLPIFIIFDGSESKFGHLKKKFSDGKIPDGYAEGVFYHIQKSGWMDTSAMKAWDEKIWVPELQKIKDMEVAHMKSTF